MKYNDLVRLNLQDMEINEAIIALRTVYNLNAPDLVLRQFYIEHSDKDSFQNLYENIDLLRIKWSLIKVPKSVFLSNELTATHNSYLNEISEDAKFYDKYGDYVIAKKENDLKYWKQEGTWRTPPVFISGTILGQKMSNYHLVEGHTRVGSLRGICRYNLLPILEEHEIYFGEY